MHHKHHHFPSVRHMHRNIHNTHGCINTRCFVHMSSTCKRARRSASDGPCLYNYVFMNIIISSMILIWIFGCVTSSPRHNAYGRLGAHLSLALTAPHAIPSIHPSKHPTRTDSDGQTQKFMAHINVSSIMNMMTII